MATPLTSKELIHLENQMVYFCWFKPENGWGAKAEGFERVHRHPAARGRDYFQIGPFGFYSTSSIEYGYEIDGHGHVYFFKSPDDAFQYVEERRQKFAAESASLLPSIIQNLQ